MKRLCSLLLLLVLNGFASTPASLVRRLYPSPAVRFAGAVYVCRSSVAYHSSVRCPGLNRCNHEVRGMRVGDARRLGKRPELATGILALVVQWLGTFPALAGHANIAGLG